MQYYRSGLSPGGILWLNMPMKSRQLNTLEHDQKTNKQIKQQFFLFFIFLAAPELCDKAHSSSKIHLCKRALC